MFADYQFSGLLLCYGPLALIILSFIAFAILTDSNARRLYLRRADPRPESERMGASPTVVDREIVAQTPAGMTVQLTPTAVAPAAAIAPDNLQRIEGIGPKIAQILATAGITTFQDVAGKSVDELKAILEAAGIANIADPASWPQQAQLLVRGEHKALEDLQANLRGGKYE